MPEVLVLLDASGSMRELDGAGEVRWASASQAVVSITRAYEDAVRWGLLVFPTGATACSLETFTEPIPSTPERIQAALRGVIPGGLTPTATALSSARTYLAARAERDVPQSVILITDGQPNCDATLDPQTCTCTCPPHAPCSCGTDPRYCLDDTGTLSMVDALAQEGVRTFVVGFGGGAGEELLGRMAEHGGTARDVPAGAPRYHRADDLASLESSLDEIAGSLGVITRPCDAGPCGGIETCTEQGWSACRAFSPGEDRPCSTVPGTCGAREVCTENGFGPCTPVAAGEERACQTRCGASTQICREDGAWDPCRGVAPGDRRTCTPSFTTCDGEGEQTCGAHGWGSCEASRVGDERPCSTACGDSLHECQADGTWGSCHGVAQGDARPCTGAGCAAPGFQLCGASGWGDCYCDPPVTTRCGCGAAEAGPAGLLIVVLWTTRRRKALSAPLPLC